MLCPINQISSNYTLNHNQALCSVQSTRLQAITLQTTTRPYALYNQPDFKQLHSQPQPGLMLCPINQISSIYTLNPNQALCSVQSTRLQAITLSTTTRPFPLLCCQQQDLILSPVNQNRLFPLCVYETYFVHVCFIIIICDSLYNCDHSRTIVSYLCLFST